MPNEEILNLRLKSIEWEYRPNISNLTTKLRLTLSNGAKSPIFGTQEQNDSNLEKFDFPADVPITSIKLWHNNQNQLFGMEFFDQHENTICKLGKEGFKQKKLYIASGQRILGA